MTKALVVVATMVVTVAVGLLLLRDEPAPTPPPAAPAPAPVAPAPSPAAATPPAEGGAASTVATSVVISPAGVRPCTVTRDGDDPVAEACRGGGQDAAKAFMKKMVKRVKDRPDRITCDTCHENTDDFTLQEEARARLADLLASIPATP